MEEVLKPDLCVIGAGSGGLSVAAAAAQFGVPVVLIEKGRMGGDCLNYGCVPSKSLLAAAKRAEAVRTASNFGIDVIEAQIDHRGVHDHVHGVIAAIAPNDSIERMTGLGVRVIQAQASFLDKFTVEAGRVLVRARRFVIATGSMPSIPPIPGLDEVPYFTNETIFDVSERIQHLIVLGGGPVGLELAQAHRMLGSHVSVFDVEQVPRPRGPRGCRRAAQAPRRHASDAPPRYAGRARRALGAGRRRAFHRERRAHHPQGNASAGRHRPQAERQVAQPRTRRRRL